MKITMNFVTLFLLFRFSKFWVSAAVIGSQAQSHAINPLAERVVTYGLAQSDAAKFAVCNADQKKVLEQAMGEAAKLAKAGADGLAIILDMLSEERTEFNKLSETERNRYRETYFTFFGRIEDKSQWQLFRDRASFIKASLDRISPLTVETWPKTIVIFCDSSYYQLKDRDGNTSDQIPSLRNQVIPEQRQIMFDTDRNGWFAPYKQVNCSAPGSKIAGYTTRVTTSNSIKGTVPLDRITFCPLWFKFIKAPATGKSFTDLDPSKDIQQGTSMTVFETKAGLGFLHETLHTFTISQAADSSVGLNDVGGAFSYGSRNAQKLAAKPETQDLANRNVENVVYWCIAMFYNTWDWSSTSANIIGRNKIVSET